MLFSTTVAVLCMLAFLLIILHFSFFNIFFVSFSINYLFKLVMENVICQGFSNCVPGFHENIMVSEAKGKRIKLKKI